MQSRNQYLRVLRERYLKVKTKKEKAQMLDEYCRNTGQVRKYVIRKIQPGVDLRPKPRKKRKQTYDVQVTAALTASEVAHWTQTSPYNVTTLINRMKQDGLLTTVYLVRSFETNLR